MPIPDDLALAAMDLAVATGDQALIDRVGADLDRDQARLNDISLPVAAISYAEQGIPVFPCRVGEKRPATRNGFKDATTDPERVHTWWADNDRYNIGFPTGVLFDVIDVDGPPGYASLVELKDAGHLPPILGQASTRRGTHLYVPVADRGNKTSLLPGIDYRGKGGYVVAPPSRSADGRRWTWHTPLNLPVLM